VVQSADDGQLSFSGELWYWRGPSPFHFVTVPEPQCQELHTSVRRKK